MCILIANKVKIFKNNLQRPRYFVNLEFLKFLSNKFSEKQRAVKVNIKKLEKIPIFLVLNFGANGLQNYKR